MEALNATAASLLGFLHGGPATGWELTRRVEESIGYFWNTTQSQVYRELKALAKAGCVEVKDEDARSTRYAITKQGRSAFGEWINQAPDPSVIRLPIVFSIFFGKHIEPRALRRYILLEKLEHEARLDAYERVRSHVESVSPFEAKTLELGIGYEKLMVAWLEGLPWGRPDSKR